MTTPAARIEAARIAREIKVSHIGPSPEDSALSAFDELIKHGFEYDESVREWRNGEIVAGLVCGDGEHEIAIELRTHAGGNHWHYYCGPMFDFAAKFGGWNH